MTAQAILAELRARGIEIVPHAGRLRYRAPAGALTEALKQAIRQHKEEILPLLSQSPALAGSSSPAERNALASPARLDLVVVRSGPIPSGPIALTPWTKVLDPRRFVECTLADLASYVAAENAGRPHWAEDLIDEKLDALRACGVIAELRRIQ